MDRRTPSAWRRSVRPFAPLLGLWATASLMLWVLVRQDGIPYEEFLLDPSQYGGRPWYVGLISNLGVLGWTAAAVSSGIGAVAAIRGGRPGAAGFLRAGATLSTLLLLDDLFQLHIIVPRTLGLPKVSFYGLYAVLAGWWILGSVSELLRTRWPLLGAAAGALSVSVVVDVVGGGREWSLVAEDSAKFLGILAWALYFVTTTTDIVGSLADAARLDRAARSDRATRPGTDETAPVMTHTTRR
ncbi:MAG: hypothetical protein AAGD35_05625 [Actinomycetota bacterium]